jgi:hypothetical protein
MGSVAFSTDCATQTIGVRVSSIPIRAALPRAQINAGLPDYIPDIGMGDAVKLLAMSLAVHQRLPGGGG